MIDLKYYLVIESAADPKFLGLISLIGGNPLHDKEYGIVALFATEKT